jgi:hypothetical protein
VNACLEKGLLIELASHNYFDSAVNAHGYGMDWYQRTVGRPADTVLGFGKSYEYTSFHSQSFPPSGDGFEKGAAYHQADNAADELVLDRKASFLECNFPAVGIVADAGVDSAIQGLREARDWTVGRVRAVRDATVNWAERTTLRLENAVNVFFDDISDAGAEILDLSNQPDLQLYLRTGLPPFLANTKALGDTNTDAYLWLEIVVPADATLMTIDFTVSGDGQNDTFAFGVGNTNLFSIETQFLPDGELMAGPVIDVSSYAGTTNEFFFGIVGGTSTNCTVRVEGIRFFSIGAPRLAVAQASGMTTLSWPSTASGYFVETTTNLSPASWMAVTNPPSLFNGRFSLTNSTTGEAQFFRLRR